MRKELGYMYIRLIKQWIKFSLLFCILFPSSLYASVEATGKWPKILIPPENFKVLEAFLTENPKGIETHTLLVIKNGTIIYERYYKGYTKNKKHFVWSMSKSFASVLIGIAEFQNFLSRNDRYPRVNPGFLLFFTALRAVLHPGGPDIQHISL